jgi:hypothetical protein
MYANERDDCVVKVTFIIYNNDFILHNNFLKKFIVVTRVESQNSTGVIQFMFQPTSGFAPPITELVMMSL